MTQYGAAGEGVDGNVTFSFAGSCGSGSAQPVIVVSPPRLKIKLKTVKQNIRINRVREVFKNKFKSYFAIQNI